MAGLFPVHVAPLLFALIPGICTGALPRLQFDKPAAPGLFALVLDLLFLPALFVVWERTADMFRAAPRRPLPTVA